MKESFFKSRAAAVLITVIVIFISAGVGISKAMAELRNLAEVHYTGENSITYDLDRKIGAAHNIITITSKYIDETETAPLRQAIDAVDAADTPSEKYAASLTLDRQAAALSEKLLLVEAKESDLKYIRQLTVEINAVNDIISRSEYNGRAAAYNAQLDEYPVAFFKDVLGIQKLELYGG